MEISRELFDQQRHPRFGLANPDRMSLAFWEWMIRGDESDSDGLAPGSSTLIEEDDVKAGYGPDEVRIHFDAAINDEKGPIWNFHRIGATYSRLSDGRVVCIGGEYEDFCDPDFYIYNDVIVFGPTGEIEIYGYPEEVFPPTDFHTATLIGHRLILIGRLGYSEARVPGTTPVFALDLSNYRISEIQTSGAMPDWIFKHEAVADEEGVITVRGGELLAVSNESQRIRRNFEEYTFNPHTGIWQRLTQRNWQQFSIRDEDRNIFVIGRRADFEERLTKTFENVNGGEFDPFSIINFIILEAVLPRQFDYEIVSNDDSKGIRLMVEGIPVAITVEASTIEILVEGEMSVELATRLAEDVRASVESVTGRRCFIA